MTPSIFFFMTQIRIHGHTAYIEDQVYINTDGLAYAYVNSYTSESYHKTLNVHIGIGIKNFYKKYKCRVCHKSIRRGRYCRACYECKNNRYFNRYNRLEPQVVRG